MLGFVVVLKSICDKRIDTKQKIEEKHTKISSGINFPVDGWKKRKKENFKRVEEIRKKYFYVKVEKLNRRKSNWGRR